MSYRPTSIVSNLVVLVVLMWAAGFGLGFALCHEWGHKATLTYTYPVSAEHKHITVLQQYPVAPDFDRMMRIARQNDTRCMGGYYHIIARSKP